MATPGRSARNRAARSFRQLMRFDHVINSDKVFGTHREAAGFLDMSPEVLQDTYGHHHPDHLHGAATAIGQKGRYVSVAETVVNLTEDRNQKKKPNDFWSEWQD